MAEGNVRKGTRAVIEAEVRKFSHATKWRAEPNAKVADMGAKFCDEMLKYAETLDDDNAIFRMELFAKVVTDLVGCTRSYEALSDDETEAIAGIFDVMRKVRSDMIDGAEFGEIFDKSMYLKSIFLENSVGREDYDCKYRQSMIFPNFVDLYEISSRIIDNWETLKEHDDFALLFVNFKQRWYYTEISTEEGGWVLLDKITGRQGPRPETAIQDTDPRYYARKFLEMLDERISK